MLRLNAAGKVIVQQHRVGGAHVRHVHRLLRFFHLPAEYGDRDGDQHRDDGDDDQELREGKTLFACLHDIYHPNSIRMAVVYFPIFAVS